MDDSSYFRDKVVVITGASSGIGRAAALAFARLHAKVVLAARDEEKLELVAEEIRLKGGQALVMPTDIRSFADTQLMARETILHWGKIDILVANAGKYVQDASRKIDILSYEQSMSVNFMGALNAVKSVLPEMQRGGKGHIVIVNSLDAKKGIVGDGPYVAAKAALDGFADVLRQELKPSGIDVTSIYPGRVDTPMLKNLRLPRISPKIPPGKVVKAMIRGIRRNKAIVIVPYAYFLLGPFNGLFPRLADRAYRILRLEGKKIEE